MFEILRRERGWWIALWVGWAVFVLSRYFVQLWRTLRQPQMAWVLEARHTAAVLLACCTVALILILIVLAVWRAWTASRRVLGRRAQAIWFLAAGLASSAWFAYRERVTAPLVTHIAYPWPATGEAVARDISAIVGAAFVAFAAFAIGDTLRRALVRSVSIAERALVSTTLGFIALSVMLLSLAALGVYRPEAVALLLVGVLIIAAAFSIADTSAPSADIQHSVPLSRGELVWGFVAFAAIGYVFVAALAPEIEYDALWYHLFLPQQWLVAGRPVDIVQEYPSLYPLGWEMLYGAGLAMGGPVAAKLLHTLCLALLALGVAIASRRFAPRASPRVAVALLVTMPTVMWEAATAYVDVALAMYILVGCYALARAGTPPKWGWLTLAALEFGGAASTKHLGLVALIVALGIYGLVLHRSQATSRSLAAAFALVLGVAVLLPMPWYVRTWQHAGNPFFPELYRVFGGGPAERWDLAAERGLGAFKAHFGRGHGVAAFVRLPWDLTIHAASFGGDLGPLPLLLIPVLLFRASPKRLVAAIGLGIACYVAVWASPVSSLQLRFLVPIAAGLALLAAVAEQQLVDGARTVGRPAAVLMQTLLVGTAVLNLPPFITFHETDRGGWNGWLTHVLRDSPIRVVAGAETERAYLTRTLPSYGALTYIDEHVPATAVVLSFSGGDEFYAAWRRIPAESIAARPAIWGATTKDAAMRALKAAGVTHVLFDRRTFADLRRLHMPIASDEFQQGCVTEYEDRSYRLCRMAWESEINERPLTRGAPHSRDPKNPARDFSSPS